MFVPNLIVINKTKIRFLSNILITAALLLMVGFNESPKDKEKTMAVKIEKQIFGKIGEKEVYLYTLTNENGVKVKITNYGGIVTSLIVPDRNGNYDDIVLGFDTLDEYVNKNSQYFGAIAGRYANRIAKGIFTLNGVTYKLAVNNGPNHLHGGIKGFDKVVWDSNTFSDANSASLELKYLSKDGEEGYPGNLTCKVIYSLTKDNELKIDYHAQTDKDTVINLTHHSYFNLAGHNHDSILNHQLMIDADKYTPVDDTLIPMGPAISLKHTPMDFTVPTPIGLRIDLVKGGYDLNFVLNHKAGSLDMVASVYDSNSNRSMQVYTTEPALQFYSGNFLDGSIKGKGAVYNKHAGFCLEAQHYPNSPNRPDFPSVVLKPGQKYKQLTVYKFYWK